MMPCTGNTGFSKGCSTCVLISVGNLSKWQMAPELDQQLVWPVLFYFSISLSYSLLQRKMVACLFPEYTFFYILTAHMYSDGKHRTDNELVNRQNRKRKLIKHIQPGRTEQQPRGHNIFEENEIQSDTFLSESKLVTAL